MTIKAAIIENGVVKNIVLCNNLEGNVVDVTELSIGVGDLYDGVAFTKAPTPELTPEQLQGQIDKVQQQEAKLNPVINYLVTHTNAEIATYIETNVTNLSTAVEILKHLATAIAVLAKRELR